MKKYELGSALALKIKNSFSDAEILSVLDEVDIIKEKLTQAEIDRLLEIADEQYHEIRRPLKADEIKKFMLRK